MIATLKGRLQTKIVTYLILGVVTLVFAWLEGPVYFYVFGVAVVTGLVLEAIWGWLITYQPGWLTWLFALIEFLVIANTAAAFGLSLSMMSAIRYYVAAWVVIQLFLIYILPIWRTNWSEQGTELW